MEESTKKNIHRMEIIGAVVLLLISIASFFPNPGITGYVSVETKKQKIDLTIANSQSYILTTNSEKPFYLTSLKISGEVIGDGIANVYINNNIGEKALIYSNLVKKNKGLDSITGMGKITGGVIGVNSADEGDSLVIEHLENIEGEVGGVSEDEVLTSGVFENKCADSCFIEMLLNKETAYQLLFYVHEGTILKVSEIEYTIRKD